jgi:uncharacterized protein (TIGR02246 family)
MTKTPSADEAAIRRLIADWSLAVAAKDLDGIAAAYTPDSVLFDAIPPYKTIGRDAIRQAWQGCLPYFPKQFTVEVRDLAVHVAGDTAWAHWLLHFSTAQADHPCGQTWMRISAGYRRLAGAWRALHEHVSVPFNPMTHQTWLIRDPAILDGPDYGSAPSSGGISGTQT